MRFLLNDYSAHCCIFRHRRSFLYSFGLRQLLFAGQINQVSMENLGTQVMSESLKMASIDIDDPDYSCLSMAAEILCKRCYAGGR